MFWSCGTKEGLIISNEYLKLDRILTKEALIHSPRELITLLQNINLTILGEYIPVLPLTTTPVNDNNYSHGKTNLNYSCY